ncbi:MAG: 2-hydroxychromene-2-carboxylate isomerase [Rhodobacter sp.]|nr:2-hydroxychromene-2-carboxylate isomerase [Paracoccaceae bacterium]MCB1409264.1 2-hydroxychromene-2-carboxylate isomerase [Paracoccaceae bacterium]MCC0077850.1 2-hydroxychromene-2-carboxylate isomerase [Rhodobacter sp.]MCC0079024.1 2-hydroxychromene-2-carboxylate isomerase [Rhodobacter sp.]
MRQIDYYFTVVSPWTYLAGNRPVEIAARHGASLRYKPVDPGALFARTGGLPLPQRHESRQAYRLQELRRQSVKAGMPLTPKPAFFPTNPAPAAYAIIAAQEAGGGDLGALVQSLCAACWAEERNVAEDEVIAECLTRAGFPASLTMSGMLIGAETYGRNLEDAVAAGVFGFPFFVVDGECFWGQDRLEDLDLFLAGKL